MDTERTESEQPHKPQRGDAPGRELLLEVVVCLEALALTHDDDGELLASKAFVAMRDAYKRCRRGQI